MTEDRYPTVSVIIPTYNRAQFVGRAIESILNQTYADLELIVVDDGSTDNTEQVVKSYKDSRVVYVWQENKERSAARNTGIQVSRGRYIAFLDSDDWFLPHKLAVQVPVLETQPDVGIVMSGWQMVDTQGNVKRQARPWQGIPGQPTLEDWLFSSTAKLSAVLIRKETLEQVGGFDETSTLILSEDMELLIRLTSGGVKTHWVRETVVTGLWHANNSLYDVTKVKSSRLCLLEKVFSQYKSAPTHSLIKNEIYAKEHIKQACFGYSVNQIEEAQSDLLKAVNFDARLLEDDGKGLVDMLVGQTNSHQIHNPIGYLECVFDNLPSQLIWLRKYKRKSLGKAWAMQTFKAYSLGKLTQVRWMALRTIKNDLHWLSNRGFTSIWAQSIVGERLWRLKPQKEVN